ncbi:hypothetical protein QR680_007038 [Steinernema hermaphroditum]|uniref:Apple domain-containing protein n=1 Tax=Steinernema hermaphroditum TaxID=289476 RepID=A0AA39HXB7_9BILA|nr:hypothetical protein QR680_007038 [Steinernema hermaphroditum]
MSKRRALVFSLLWLLCGTINSANVQVHFRVSNDTELAVDSSVKSQNVTGSTISTCLEKCARDEKCTGGLFLSDGLCYTMEQLKVNDSSDAKKDAKGGHISFVKVDAKNETLCDAMPFKEVVQSHPTAVKPDKQ